MLLLKLTCLTWESVDTALFLTPGLASNLARGVLPLESLQLWLRRFSNDLIKIKYKDYVCSCAVKTESKTLCTPYFLIHLGKWMKGDYSWESNITSHDAAKHWVPPHWSLVNIKFSQKERIKGNTYFKEVTRHNVH